MDTQWPRWEVFKQDAPARPHQAVGSVHAVDPQHALVTARTVFARRPSAVSMWVARAQDILARTAEELETGIPEPSPTDGTPEAFLVFRKTTHRRSMTFADHVGELEAPSAEAALRLARERFRDEPALAWWIVPARAVTRSPDDDATVESWFAPARDKTYRQQSAYGTVGSHASRRRHDPASHDG